LVGTAARLRLSACLQTPEVATKLALRSIARRYQALTHEITVLDQLVAETAPALLAIKGVGTDTAGALLVAAGDNPERLRSEGAFAHRCGVAPVPASSGKTHRYRFTRGGNRDANRALYLLAIGRLRWDARTRTYVAKRTEAGKTKPEIIRCLKRYIAREVYHALMSAPA
jgi:transposase